MRRMNSIKIAQHYNDEMRRSLVLAWFAAFTCSGSASISAEITQAYTVVKTNILKAADKMPDANYSFKPTPEVRTFAEVLDHIADSQMRTCAPVAGDEVTPKAAGRTSKTEVTAALNDTFAECDKAYGSLSDANAADTVTTAHGPQTKLGTLTGNLAHDSEEYGTLAMYLRLKGIVPPSSDH